jgi:hypothetical protein
MKTKTRKLVIIVFGLAAVTIVSSCSKEHRENKKVMKSAENQTVEIGRVEAVTVTTVATIESVDKAKRTVKIRTAYGGEGTYRIGKEAKNFKKIKPGDQVKMTLVESVAVFVGPSDIKPGVGAVQTVGLAPKGSKPGMVVANTAEGVARIDAIDTENRTVTLTGVTDVPTIVTVGPNVDLAKVSAGDSVIVRYTEATVIAVEKP